MNASDGGEASDRIESSVLTIADAIVRARATGVLLEPAGLPSIPDRQQAYAVQREVGRRLDWWHDERSARVWKVGAPDATSVPTAACLDGGSILRSGAQVALDTAGWLGFEIEVALRVAGVDHKRGHAEVHIDACCAAIELVSTRFIGGSAVDPLLKLADQQSSAGLILGPWSEQVPSDWGAVFCELSESDPNHGIKRQLHAARHPCGDPFFGLNWLAAHAASFGLPLAAGDIMTTGSWVGLLDMDEPGSVRAAFVGMEPVTANFD